MRAYGKEAVSSISLGYYHDHRCHLLREVYGPTRNQVSLPSEEVQMGTGRGTDQLRDIDFPIL